MQQKTVGTTMFKTILVGVLCTFVGATATSSASHKYHHPHHHRDEITTLAKPICMPKVTVSAPQTKSAEITTADIPEAVEEWPEEHEQKTPEQTKEEDFWIKKFEEENPSTEYE